MNYTCIALAGALIDALKCTNNSSNGEPDAALKGTLHGGVNVALEGAS